MMQSTRLDDAITSNGLKYIDTDIGGVFKSVKVRKRRLSASQKSIGTSIPP
jgi:hypothetical protein